MKSRFDGIIKVKKQELDQAEMVLMQARARARMLETKIKNLFDQITTFDMPSSGDFNKMQQARQILMMLRTQKVELGRELDGTRMQIIHCQNVYQAAHEELEKMKYLKEDETAKKLKVIKKREQNDLDEIAVQLFARSGA